MAESSPSTFGGRICEGRVIKASSEKTRVVAIELRAAHRLYGKGISHISRCVTHDEGNISGVGDIVRIRECRPMSKTKRWRLLEVLATAHRD
ncbi:MAG: 30S ribosomal protein S17 [Candidatus Latescibacterota bacterium]|nr:30S ribosomal protein S17 [Candidatus Latescibacterota bacterium]